LRNACARRKNAQKRRSRIVAKPAKHLADDLRKIVARKRTDFLARVLEDNTDGLKMHLEALIEASGKASVRALVAPLAEVAGTPAKRSDAGAASAGAPS